MTTRILIVDDIEINLRLLEMALETLPTTVDRSLSGEGAVELATRNEYAAILMDIHMPRMNGFECVEKIRSLPLHKLTPVIFITASGNQESYVRQGYEVGAIDYLSKPFRKEELLARIETQLRAKQLLEQINENSQLRQEIEKRKKAAEANEKLEAIKYQRMLKAKEEMEALK